ncbi:dnaJ homolog subfamily C member 4 [Austrofundulus limnaeus]|uniref:DnaJ homolog subfamily C member 4 n=1 Tax=Austrofundulus limnaeus TaxID=52670 RepID=A0A2I4B081_AUSLI|nr:PREDICTED: dnaJ homolog subfamily C member 4 [Austrofundulus limnaeus]XP_013861141.1 PREDICTED: dnaJ homolog subfamily C member 4 [Austrofundulus limnaeus]
MQLEAQLRLCRSCILCYKSGLQILSRSYAQKKAANYYDLLGVKTDATSDEIKNAFFDKSKKLHPDSDPSNPALHGQFVELNEAYRILSKELSRKEYDFKLHRPYSGGQAFRSTSNHSNYGRPHAQESSRYWEQFRHSQSPKMTEEDRQHQKRRNLQVAMYCVIGMMLGIGVHVVLFKKLNDIHTNFMDEKDRAIMKIYNEAKERARVNGFEKQIEILRQNHDAFQEKLKTMQSGRHK